jgi:colanic acid/amylovoran biosynthesis glycosyltransferase
MTLLRYRFPRDCRTHPTLLVRILGPVETLDTTRADVLPVSATRSGIRSVAPSTTRLAYLLSRYPAVSHTFFLNEVLGLRARGLHIETVSINPPDRPLDALPANEAAEAEATLYLKGGSRLASIVKLLAIIFSHPAALVRGLFAVARVPDLTLVHRFFWLFYLAEALLLGRWMRARNLPHLHVHFGGAVASVGMLTAAAWRIPWSLTIHGPEELLNTHSYHLREKVASASFVFCISDFCRSQLCALTPPEQWRKFEVVRLGVNPVTLTPISRSSISGVTVPGERTYELVSVGRLVPAKGQLILLDAVRILRNRQVHLHLTLIGTGPEKEDLDQYVVTNHLEDAVTFTGALDHAHTLAYVRRAEIFALPSFAEGIPVALMEAMSLGLPCVSTYVAGIPELIRSGVDGLLVPPANAPALADALESLTSDSAFRKALGHSARQRIISLYNLPLNQELLAQHFDIRLHAHGHATRAT